VDLAGRTVLLTGAAGGIGAAAARRLAAAGCRLALVDIDRDRLEDLREEIGDLAIAAPADVSDLGQMEAAVAAAMDRFGQVSVVVANAAVDAIAPVSEIEPAAFDRVVEVNLLGTYRTVRAALPSVRAERGHILVINSLGSIVPPPFQSAYAASKAGISAFADSLRLELRGSGTTVGQLYFGAVDTDHFRAGMSHPLMERANRRIPKSFTRPDQPHDAAAAIQRAIEQRSRRSVFPRSNAPLLWAPQIIQRMVERRISN
jgi:NAD(P)-dependent dehydrogenase (short-subunit alcohol dehydrogenase family)